jgi:hypothetical protein
MPCERIEVTFRISSLVVRLAIVTLLWMTGPIISLIALSKATSMILERSRIFQFSKKNVQGKLISK